MKRKILSVLLALVLLCAMLPATPASAAVNKEFKDVNSSHWFAGSVYALSERGIINGSTPDRFEPNKNLTRAEFVQLLAASQATKEELEECRNLALFDDVSSKNWFAPAVNWGKEHGFANGSDGKFSPNSPVTRQEAATFVAQFAANIDGVDLTPKQDKVTFKDNGKIDGWAVEKVYACQMAGVISGDERGFRPKDKMLRCEAASILCRLLNIEPLDKSEVPQAPTKPEPPTPSTTGEPVTFSKTAAGFSVTGVEFNPQNYDVKAVVANNKFFTTETAASIVKRTGAEIAVNGAFYNSYNSSDLTTYSNMVSGGNIVRLDNQGAPYRPSFVIDGDGKASIQAFKTRMTVSLVQGGSTVDHFDDVACNQKLGNNDGARMIYTSAFGSKVSGTIARGAVVNASGEVTKVYKSPASNVPIPASGFILVERMVRGEWEKFFDRCQVGDQLQITMNYEGSATQNIVTALSNGPTVVKDGKAYGKDPDTYRKQEGFTDDHILVGSSARMAIGVKPDGTVVIAHAVCSLQDLSKVMLALGCEDAMNLDGGASCALYVKGSQKVAPGRNMSNMLVFTRK